MTNSGFSIRPGLAAGVLACAVFMSAVGFAQSKPAGKPLSIAGKYEGLARSTPDGDLAATLTIVQDGSTFTGTMAAGSYSFSVLNGKLDGPNLSWSFSDGSTEGTATGAYKAGAITGSWWAGGMTFRPRAPAAPPSSPSRPA